MITQPKNENKFVTFLKMGFWAMLRFLICLAIGITVAVALAKMVWNNKTVESWRDEASNKFSGLRQDLYIFWESLWAPKTKK